MRILERRGGGLGATVLGAAVLALVSGCGGSSSAASSATTAKSTAASTAPAASASAVPARLTFFPSVVSVKPSGVATLVAGCSGPPYTESCTFALVLERDGGGAQLGVLGGRAPGSITGNLTLRLNAAGRRDLAAGTLHVLATGTITTSAHLVTKVRRRLTLKKR
jgi:hypothetical protein